MEIKFNKKLFVSKKEFYIEKSVILKQSKNTGNVRTLAQYLSW